MQLSVERFTDFAKALAEHRSQDSHVVGRGPHGSHAAFIKIAPISSHRTPDSIRALVGNLTVDEMELRLPDALAIGQKFVAELPSRGHKTVNLLCVVVGTTKTPDGGWSHRCEFICTIAAEHASDAAEIHRISASMLDW